MEFVDIPLEELFEVPYLDDYGTGWCSVWNGYVYVTLWYFYKENGEEHAKTALINTILQQRSSQG